MARLRIDCREADRLLSLRKDARLAGTERLSLWLHLSYCAACRTVRRNLDFLSGAVRRLDRPGPPPGGGEP
jgi:hypothetical protein